MHDPVPMRRPFPDHRIHRAGGDSALRRRFEDLPVSWVEQEERPCLPRTVRPGRDHVRRRHGEILARRGRLISITSWLICLYMGSNATAFSDQSRWRNVAMREVVKQNSSDSLSRTCQLSLVTISTGQYQVRLPVPDVILPLGNFLEN